MLKKRLTKNQYHKLIFLPEELEGVYKYQEDFLQIFKVGEIKGFHRKKKRFLESKRGQVFLSYRKKLIRQLHGLDVWVVDGTKLRSGQYEGDVDFTMGGHGYRYLYIPTHEIWIEEAFFGTRDFDSIVWHEYIERILMRNGLSYEQGHRVASRLEIVLRDKKYFVLPVGTHRQNHPWTCGPAALKIVADYLRYPVRESYVSRLCKATPKKGADPADMIGAAEKLGFTAKNFFNLTHAEVVYLLNDGNPVIANYQYTPEYGEGHYAVIIGYGKDFYILSDPASDNGYEIVSIKKFHKNWYELEDKTKGQGIVISNKE